VQGSQRHVIHRRDDHVIIATLLSSSVTSQIIS
jgi:hypothetical protein